MIKNSFRSAGFISLFILLFVSIPYASVLRWNAVESTETFVVKGYKVHYGTVYGQYPNEIDVGNVTFYDLDLINLIPTQKYYFSVSAYSVTDMDGSLSNPIPYTDCPNIVEYPLVDHANDIIDVTYNEGSMVGANIKNNYLFSPTILFDGNLDIHQSGQTFRLFMNDIPKYVIFKMEVRNVTDSKGNPLISDSITLNDADRDKMADDWEADYGISLAFLDSDSDGLYNGQEYKEGTNPLNSDSDDDGMDDEWEVRNSLDPLVDDSGGDIDLDGISNLVEYNEGTGVSNRSPDTPQPVLPANFSVGVELTPQLRVAEYYDYEGDAHVKTQWQISSEETFTIPESILFELEIYEPLTHLDIPEFILDPNRTYYWRVRFFDAFNGRSLWSDPFSFSTTLEDHEDSDGNGVPDNLQITDGLLDLNADGNVDVSSSTYKLVSYDSLSIGLEAIDNVTSIVSLKTINPDDILDSVGKPANLIHGLIQFKIEVDNPGDTADIRFYFSEQVGESWYKYDLINGWSEYSNDYPGYVEFSSDGKSVLLRLVDGGPGDGDGVANGFIVDPSGPGGITAAVSGSSNPSSSGDTGGGGCFIATAAFGSPVEKHVRMLKDFRDDYLLKYKVGRMFVNVYYKYSPPIANIIAERDNLRVLVRIGLIPLITFCYVLIYMSLVQQIAVAFLLTSGLVLTWHVRRKYLPFKNGLRWFNDYRFDWFSF